MANFIKLHETGTNSPIVINAACIEYISIENDPKTAQEQTYIFLNDERNCYVYETIDKIYDMIK